MSQPWKLSGRTRWLVLGTLAVVLVTGWSVRAVSHQVNHYRYYSVPTASMAPTIRPGDRVQVELAGRTERPLRHEIWVFAMPGAAPGTIGVKRVIGLPGETVEISGGQVLVDGQAVVEPYLKAAPAYAMTRTLGPDEYLVLGDNRNASNDSHIWGPVKGRGFIGRVRMRCWPPSRFGGL